MTTHYIEFIFMEKKKYCDGWKNEICVIQQKKNIQAITKLIINNIKYLI